MPKTSTLVAKMLVASLTIASIGTAARLTNTSGAATSTYGQSRALTPTAIARSFHDAYR